MGKINLRYTEESVFYFLSNIKKLHRTTYENGEPEQIIMLLDTERILKAIKLTEKQRDIIQLYCIDELTQRETAEVLGISQQAVVDHLKKIKLKIKSITDTWEENL